MQNLPAINRFALNLIEELFFNHTEKQIVKHLFENQKQLSDNCYTTLRMPE
jgi:hypothetical protein